MTVENESLTDDALETETPTTEGTNGETAVVENAGEAKETALDVIGAAIDEASKPRAIQPKQEEQDQSDTRPRNAKGEFIAETDEDKATREAAEAAAKLAAETPEEKAVRLAAETPEEKTAREAAEAAAIKKPDAVNDPIPAGLNKRTAERMKELIDTVQQQKAIVESHTQLFDAVREAGSPDEFAAMLNYMRGVRSNDPAVLDKAYEMLQGELRGLAIRMGKPLYEVNLLRDPANQDLVDEIRDGTITNNRAHELALARETQKQRTGNTKREEIATTAEEDRQTGMSDLNTLEQQLIVRDGEANYRAKRTVLESTLKATMKKVNPREWKEIFADAYDGLKLAPPPVAAVTPNIVRQQPLRPKQPAGASGANTEPKSALDAMNLALGS
jgi:hypothetical protein